MRGRGGSQTSLGRGAVVIAFIILSLIPVPAELWKKNTMGNRNIRFDSEAEGIVTR